MSTTVRPQPKPHPPMGMAWIALAVCLAPVLAACGGGVPAPAQPRGAVNPASSPTEVSPSGDVPNDAVFVTYKNTEGGYSIQYVEGWTVQPGPSGAVSITDIDSAERVAVKPLPAGDLQHYVTGTDEAQVKTQVQNYQRTGLDALTVSQRPVIKLTYTSISAPDPVTNKTRAVTSERYYIPGPDKLAVLTLTTPTGVDNVDAFRQVLESFAWR